MATECVRRVLSRRTVGSGSVAAIAAFVGVFSANAQAATVTPHVVTAKPQVVTPHVVTAPSAPEPEGSPESAPSPATVSPSATGYAPSAAAPTTGRGTHRSGTPHDPLLPPPLREEQEAFRVRSVVRTLLNMTDSQYFAWLSATLHFPVPDAISAPGQVVRGDGTPVTPPADPADSTPPTSSTTPSGGTSGGGSQSQDGSSPDAGSPATNADSPAADSGSDGGDAGGGVLVDFERILSEL